MIRKAWAEQKEIRAVMIFLQSHGVGSGYAAKIYKQYGNEAIKIVQENPYRLARISSASDSSPLTKLQKSSASLKNQI
jgi:hypothetical protein